MKKRSAWQWASFFCLGIAIAAAGIGLEKMIFGESNPDESWRYTYNYFQGGVLAFFIGRWG